jgi:hypothetical protein
MLLVSRKPSQGEDKEKGKNLFAGFLPSVAAAVPANAAYFISYDILNALFECYLNNAGLSLLQRRILISAIATLPQALIKVPAEVLKQRMQIGDAYMTETLVSLVSEEVLLRISI